MRVLLTGAAGFIGHHVLEHLLLETDWDIVCLDRLDDSGSLDRLADIQRGGHRHEFGRGFTSRVSVVHHDLKAALNSHARNRIGPVEIILHLAAASHVDRSIIDPMSFVQDNVVGTCNLLNYARSLVGLQKFLYFSTDEIFGPAPDGVEFCEWDAYHSNNPYAASKAGAEELVLSYYNTYGLPIMITHTMNCFGERQDPEKFIPMCVRRILAREEIFIHADKSLTRPGSRFYIHARNVASAVLFLVNTQIVGDKFNIVGECEIDNRDMVVRIAEIIGLRLTYRLVDFHSSRPGHDLRYALDGAKMREGGWVPPIPFKGSLERTVRWMVQHREWLI